jgi:hypothetical protein
MRDGLDLALVEKGELIDDVVGAPSFDGCYFGRHGVGLVSIPPPIV